MRVLLVATVQSHICQFHKPLVAMLRGQGCEIHVAARDNLAEKNGLKLDFADRVFDVPFSRSPKSRDNIKAYKALKKIIDEGGYDVVHCNTPMGGIIARLAARKARKRGTKVFYTAHGFHFYKGAPKKNWMIYYPIEKFFARYTDKLITINEEDHEFAKNHFKCEVCRIHGVGADPERFHPVSDEEKAEYRKELGIKEGSRVIMCVGELLPNKNQKTAIKAMKEVVKKVPEALLLIAGNGPEKDNLQALIDELDLNDSVKLIGYTTQLEKYLQASDLLVACSIREGLGMNVIEAMLCGKPVVASKNRGHNELVKDGVNGFLVDACETGQYSDRIIEVLIKGARSIEMGGCGSKAAMPYSAVSVSKDLKTIYGF
ncbi:MAG: glycosyltransferase family 4 protein [Clostridia bacterium]|nr:glycosyltransferase family 4 protein [Clostridia bacterium]